jgi:hypothetical protein
MKAAHLRAMLDALEVARHDPRGHHETPREPFISVGEEIDGLLEVEVHADLANPCTFWLSEEGRVHGWDADREAPFRGHLRWEVKSGTDHHWLQLEVVPVGGS